MILEDLDPIYFANSSWPSRLKNWLAGPAASAHPFLGANAEAVRVISMRRDVGLRMAVNIPAHALLLFIRDRYYKNAYERTPEVGSVSGPSNTRVTVDEALFPSPKEPKDFYFGAAVLGGTGVRYYGEYCLVLEDTPTVIPSDTQVLDRNSYDVLFPPLSTCGPPSAIMSRLRGTWDPDLLAIAQLKVLPDLGDTPRLSTAGTASEGLLHDESFVEVHKHESFRPADVHEVRESAADAAVEADLTGRRARGQPLSAEEHIWLARRHAVDRELARAGIRTRIVVSSGRTPR